MPVSVMLAVLAGAFLHAAWNVSVKAGGDKHLETALLLAGGALIAVLLLPVLPRPAIASLPEIGLSVGLHVAYFTLLARAYHAGDMAHLYPLMRGVPPLLLAVLGPLFGETLAPAHWWGIGLISAGVLSLGLGKGAAGHGRASLVALLNAGVIAGYTLNDGIGARLSGAPLSYTLAMFLATAVVFLGWALFRRGRALFAVPARRWGIGLLAAGCSIGSYALALWAMTRAPIAPVAALRETAILFGMGLARLMLRERLGPARQAAAALILAGAVTLRLL